MIESIFLDLLLATIVLLMTAIGAYRGGMREAFSAAGVAVGVLLALEWAGRWGGWLADDTNLSAGGARFAMAVAILVVATALVGYGVGTSFNYHPGPGGRMFGMALGAGSALVAIAYVLTWMRNDLFDGTEPEVVRQTYIARFLDGNAGIVLLVVSAIVLASTLFASFVRERDDDEAQAASEARTMTAQRQVTVDLPEKVEPVKVEQHLSTPVRIRPARQWDDRAGGLPVQADRQWSNTWPSDAPGVPPKERPARTGEVQQARERRRGQQGSDGTS